jgi:hypothetical protein
MVIVLKLFHRVPGIQTEVAVGLERMAVAVLVAELGEAGLQFADMSTPVTLREKDGAAHLCVMRCRVRERWWTIGCGDGIPRSGWRHAFGDVGLIVGAHLVQCVGRLLERDTGV